MKKFIQFIIFTFIGLILYFLQSIADEKIKIGLDLAKIKMKRLKELETLQKTGILTKQEFEKLKADLLK